MDVIHLPIEYDKKKIDSRYRLVIIATQRARELLFGAKQRVQTKVKKVTTASILEGISGEIDFLTGEDAVEARDKAEKIDYKKLVEVKRRPIEDLSELEKDLRVYLHEKEETERALEELFSETEETAKDEE